MLNSPTWRDHKNGILSKLKLNFFHVHPTHSQTTLYSQKVTTLLHLQ